MAATPTAATPTAATDLPRPRGGDQPTADDPLAPPYVPAHVPTLFTLDDLLDVLDLRADATAFDGDPIRAGSLPSGHGGVLGAQQLAQQVVVAERLHPGKRVQTLHTMFTSTGRSDRPVDIQVERLQQGRTFDSVALTISQGSERLSRADVLLTADEPDFVRHAAPPPRWSSPETAVPVRRALIPWEARMTTSPDRYGNDLWLRTGAARVPADPTLWRALLAVECEALAVSGVASGHGLGDSYAGVVLAQTMTYLDELDVRDWHRLDVTSPFAGGGRSLAGGRIYDSRANVAAVFEAVGLLRQRRPQPDRVT